MKQHICVISQRYPCAATPALHVFVQKLVHAMADLGAEVTVISPIPVLSRKYKGTPAKYEEKTEKGSSITIYRPRFMYFGQKFTKPINTAKISVQTMFDACVKVIDENSIKADAFYGHFICAAGLVAARLGRKYDKPSFFAFGESSDWSYRHYGFEAVRKELASVSGVVAVSTLNRQRLIDDSIVDGGKIKVFVNGVNTERFYPRDREESRKKFNVPKDAFTAAFVGQFVERKGVLVANEAMRMTDTLGLFAGSGDEVPTGEHVLHAKRLTPEEIPYMLSAADVFVFPSVNEGCSNALLEAMACAVPIVATDAEFNYDILDATNSIMVDGTKAGEIAAAITKLKDDPELRRSMAAASLEKVKSLTIEKRAENILAFIRECGEKYASGK